MLIKPALWCFRGSLPNVLLVAADNFFLQVYKPSHEDCLRKDLGTTSFFGLIARTWQKEGLSVAKACLNRLSTSSVVVTDHKIGLFIPALW